MKAEIHPEYVFATVHCSCGNSFVTRSTVAGAERRDLLAVPPVLHGQAEARRHRRPRRALPAAAREGRPLGRDAARLLAMAQAIGGQAVLEGVMMRGPRNWAVAVRKPDGQIAQVARPIDSAMARHWVAAAADRPRRRRARRVALDRLPRALGLGELRRRRGRERGRRGAPPRSAAGRCSSPSPSRSGSRSRVFKVGPALLADTLPISNGTCFVLVEGADPDHDLRRLPRAAQL